MIWAKEETLPRSEIEAIQLSKLKDTVHYIYDRVKPYREKMDAAGVKPEDIPFLAQSAYDDACRPGNPRETSTEEIAELYRSLL